MMDDTKTIVIPDPVCRESGIVATWATSDIISTRAYQHVTSSTKDKPTPFANREIKIHHIKKENILEDIILRKLVNESNGNFLSIQQLPSDNVQPKLVVLSRQYRSIIRACLENLQEKVNNPSCDKTAKDIYQNYVTIFYSVECIWHLCEILLIDPAPGNIVVPQLLSWIRLHFHTHEKTASQLLVQGVGAQSNPEYWKCIRGHLTQGRPDVVRALLKLHSSADSAPFKLADNLLRTMPLYNIYGFVSVNEFTNRWRHWCLDCNAQIDSNAFISEKNLENIMKLLVGDNEAWQEERMSSTAWYELFPGWLLYTDPSVKWYSLAPLVRNWFMSSNQETSLSHLDKLILAVMECDMQLVIREIQHMSENGWFATHLSDLLYHCARLNLLDNSEINITPALRESLILEYGSLLFTMPGLWQAGLSYLDHCPEFGRAAQAMLLARLPLTTDHQACRVLRAAMDRGLHDVVSSICKVRGMLFLRRGRLGNALAWALKSQDRDFATYLADRFLKSYNKDASLKSTDMLQSLGSCMLISDRLIFLAKYQEFHNLYQAKSFNEAGRLLVSLLDITPKYFWFTLLTDSLPLLEADEIVFDKNDTFVLMQSLTTFCNEFKNDESKSDQIKLIRYAATRNLSRAVIKEGCEL